MNGKLSILIIAVSISSSCGTSKKSTATAAVKTTEPAPATAPYYGSSFPFVQPLENPVPGDDVLAAVQTKYKDVTMEQLKEGHAIYTTGACVSCHGADNISKYGEVQWKNILDEMAIKANITAEQKEAVSKYVLAVKTLQTK